MEIYVKIEFNISKEKICLYSKKENKKNIECNFSNGSLICKIFYDYNEQPLSMETKAKLGNNVKIILMPFRIELRINSVVKDEEWPAGNCLFNMNDKIESEVDFSICEYEHKKEIQPYVIGKFENAKGWKPQENIFVGDCMPSLYDNRYHVFYLKDRHHHKSKWGKGAHQWEHISTKDMKEWEIHPIAVEITDPTEGSICTGSHIQKKDKHYLFYTIRMADGSPAPICRSVSSDGYHFEKDTDFHFTLSEKYDMVNARDPKIVIDENGFYHMILTTGLKEEKKGCLAHLISKDLDIWKEENPIFISDSPEQPECPDYIKYNGYYYLNFSLGKNRYMVSKKPFSDFTFPKNPDIPCGAVPKGAVWNNEILFTGFDIIDGYAGTLTFVSATNDEDGNLIFKKL